MTPTKTKNVTILIDPGVKERLIGDYCVRSNIANPVYSSVFGSDKKD